MLIDLTCPAEIFRTTLPTEEVPAALLTLFNLSDRVIASVVVSLRLLDETGTETERVSYRGRALNGRPRSTFTMTVPCTAAGVHSVEASLETVWFTDNETWRRDPAREVEYTPNRLPVSRALTGLQYVAGETAVGWPAAGNGLWICVCGRPNPEGADCCARCGRDREMIFSRYTPEAVEAQISLRERQLDLNSRSMREDTIRLQRIREAEYRTAQLRRKRRVRIFALWCAAMLLCAAVLFAAAPGLKRLAEERAARLAAAPGAAETDEKTETAENPETADAPEEPENLGSFLVTEDDEP